MKSSSHSTGFIADEKIVGMFFDRDERAINAVDLRYGQELLSVARNILDSREDAEECLQDTYLHIWNSIPPNKPDHLLSYMIKILKNLAISMLRKQQADRRIPKKLMQSTQGMEDILSSETTVEEEAEANEINWIINEYLNRSSAEFRFLFIAVFVFGKSVRQT